MSKKPQSGTDPVTIFFFNTIAHFDHMLSEQFIIQRWKNFKPVLEKQFGMKHE